MEAPSLLLLSLPNDIVVNILARGPRHYHPILSCTSKELRSLLGKDCFYVCFNESIGLSRIKHWYTLLRIVVWSRSQSLLRLSHTRLLSWWVPRSTWLAALLIILRRLVATVYPAVGLVDDKINIFGGVRKDEEIRAQVFDLKTQTWQVAPNPTVHVESLSMSVVSPSLDRKIYARVPERAVMVYDPRDGQCDIIRVPDHELYSNDLCVMMMIYMQYHGVGLMWYNSKTNEWRVVDGLELKGLYLNHVMVEYNGKLAFLWYEWNKMEIWCTMIVLYGSRVV